MGLHASYVKGIIAELAIADIDKARELGLETAWGYNARGNAYRLLGDFEPAERDYRRAIELDPAKVDAHLNLGDTRFFAGDLEAALASYETAALLDADDENAGEKVCHGSGGVIPRRSA